MTNTLMHNVCWVGHLTRTPEGKAQIELLLDPPVHPEPVEECLAALKIELNRSNR